jgi:hypothetical protein
MRTSQRYILYYIRLRHSRINARGRLPTFGLSRKVSLVGGQAGVAQSTCCRSSFWPVASVEFFGTINAPCGNLGRNLKLSVVHLRRFLAHLMLLGAQTV